MDGPLANIRAIQNAGRVQEALPKRDGREGTRRQFESELDHEKADHDSPAKPAAPPPPPASPPPPSSGSSLDYQA